MFCAVIRELLCKYGGVVCRRCGNMWAVSRVRSQMKMRGSGGYFSNQMDRSGEGLDVEVKEKQLLGYVCPQWCTSSQELQIPLNWIPYLDRRCPPFFWSFHKDRTLQVSMELLGDNVLNLNDNVVFLLGLGLAI